MPSNTKKKAGAERLLTQPEAADLLNVSATHVKRLRLTGALPYVRLGAPPLGAVRIKESDLAAYVAAHTEGDES